jgi:hypothetical protein
VKTKIELQHDEIFIELRGILKEKALKEFGNYDKMNFDNTGLKFSRYKDFSHYFHNQPKKFSLSTPKMV